MNVLGATMLGTVKGLFTLRESLCAESVCCRDVDDATLNFWGSRAWYEFCKG